MHTVFLFVVFHAIFETNLGFSSYVGKLACFGKLSVSRAVETDAKMSSFFVELVESGLGIPDVVYVVEILWTKLLKQLTDSTYTNCAKDLETALEFKRQGNKAFGSSSFQEASGLYTEVRCPRPRILIVFQWVVGCV
jgi:hypothetical protein